MGCDKAMLELEGRTLLARAVSMLREVEGFGDLIEVTICGEREALEGADRAIVDRYPECGPLGGIEAALGDLGRNEDAEWAFFIPVDMPLLKADLIDRLLARWFGETQVDGSSVRACMVEVEGRPQPLVSLVHRSVHGLVRDALDGGRYKVVPVLQSAGAYCASLEQEITCQDTDVTAGESATISNGRSGLRSTSVKPLHRDDEARDAARSEDRLIKTYEQFANVNTEADLIRVATLLKQRGLDS